MFPRGFPNTKNTIEFIVVQAPSSYNVLLGRPSLNKMRAVISTEHLRMKFPTPQGVGLVRTNQKTARQCYAVRLEATKEDERKRKVRTPKTDDSAKEVVDPEVLNYEVEDFSDEVEAQRPKPMGDLEVVQLGDNAEKTVQINMLLHEAEKAELIQLLKASSEVFAWRPADMSGIDLKLILTA